MRLHPPTCKLSLGPFQLCQISSVPASGRSVVQQQQQVTQLVMVYAQ